jgi:hypothetical protein
MKRRRSQRLHSKKEDGASVEYFVYCKKLLIILDDFPFGDGTGEDYNVVIQDRLKKANEELKHDQTPAQSKHRQRVSFDTVVTAVDIVQDPAEYDNTNPLTRPVISSIIEEPSTDDTSSQSETSKHQYSVPLNDTQPREGPTLLQQLKAMQFHGVLPTNERWGSTGNDTNSSDSSIRDGIFFYFY